MTENNDVQQVRSVDDTLFGGGVPTFKFENPGDKVRGTVLEHKMVPQKHPKGTPKEGQLKYYEKSGRQAFQIEVLLQTTLRDRTRDDDDGKRRIFVKEFGQPRDALAKAIKDSGCDRFAVGGELEAEYYEDGEAPFKGASKEKLYRFTFWGPSDRALADKSERAKAEPARKETREAKQPKTTRVLLEENGLPAELAAVLPENADDVQPELLEALKNQHGKK